MSYMDVVLSNAALMSASREQPSTLASALLALEISLVHSGPTNESNEIPFQHWKLCLVTKMASSDSLSSLSRSLNRVTLRDSKSTLH